jgi:sialate O-acetylesterase
MNKIRQHIFIRTLGILISILIFTNLELSAQSSERLINGDFEIGIPTIDKSPSFNCKGWRRQLWREGSFNSWLTDAKLDPRIGKDNQALRFRWGATTIYQFFSARAQGNYQFGVDTLNTGDIKSAWDPRISVQWFNSNHQAIGNPIVIDEADVTKSPIKIWHRLEGFADAPNNTAYGKFIIEINKRKEGAYFQATFFDNASVIGQNGSANRPPSFISSPYSLQLDNICESTLHEDSLLKYADDLDQDPLKFTLIKGPLWLRIDPSGAMRASPEIADIGKHIITVKVDDQRGGTDTQSLQIEVIGHLRLANLFDDEMVLQRGELIPVWGQALPNTAVTVFIGNGLEVQTKSDAAGNWKVQMPAMPATRQGATTLTVTSGPRRLHLANILVGDVWMCSGQSNMAWTLKNTDNLAAATAAASNPNLRIVKTPDTSSNTRWSELNERANWQIAGPDTIKDFSAVAYYFGKELLSEGIPIGLINSSQGGSRIESWTASPTGSKKKTFYNSRIMPYTYMPITGAIWYQGESNINDGPAYKDKMVKLVNNWRDVWSRNSEQFPFYFVQLAPFKYKHGNDELLPELWVAQAVAEKQIPNTAMAVINDIGNLSDIHPRNKAPVGQRLGMLAKHNTYGHKDSIAHSPKPESVEKSGEYLRVTFTHTGAGLSTRDGTVPKGFEIAGIDGDFTKAVAEIDGHAVVLKAPLIQDPTHVRFAWNAATQANLVNSAGLPISAFKLSK